MKGVRSRGNPASALAALAAGGALSAAVFAACTVFSDKPNFGRADSGSPVEDEDSGVAEDSGTLPVSFGSEGNSCDGGLANCGATESCCTSLDVPRGTFKRNYDAVKDGGYEDFHFSASVSDFRLDKFEVTVGRFRKFVAAYPDSRPPTGAGKNPSIDDDPGWDETFTPKLAKTRDEFMIALQCEGSAASWTDAPGASENKPINCLNWFEAFAFCLWDGGRLPTTTEWNYAAAGGEQQRAYPWSSPPTSIAIVASNAVYSPEKMQPVGTKPAGIGRFGQLDLAGNTWEWVFDVHNPVYVNPCINCGRALPLDGKRIVRGGSFSNAASYLRNGNYAPIDPGERRSAYGVRCARPAVQTAPADGGAQ